jgi:hypothetical protein
MLLPVEMFLFANISYDIVIHITPSMTKNMLNKVDTYHVMERIKFIAATCKKTIFPRQGRYIKFFTYPSRQQAESHSSKLVEFTCLSHKMEHKEYA